MKKLRNESVSKCIGGGSITGAACYWDSCDNRKIQISQSLHRKHLIA